MKNLFRPDDPHGPQKRRSYDPTPSYCWCCMESWPCQSKKNEVARELKEALIAATARYHAEEPFLANLLARAKAVGF